MIGDWRLATSGWRLPHPALALVARRQPLFSTRPLDAVLADLPRDGVAVEAEELGGIADVSFRALERARDEHLLELATGLVVPHALLEQFLHELVELIAHGQRSSCPESSRKASTYLSRVRRITSSGRAGTGGCLFQRIS